jgi:hypothetical protein
LKKDKETKTDSDWVIAKNASLYSQISAIQHNCIQIGNDIDFPVYDDRILSKKDQNTVLYV